MILHCTHTHEIVESDLQERIIQNGTVFNVSFASNPAAEGYEIPRQIVSNPIPTALLSASNWQVA